MGFLNRLWTGIVAAVVGNGLPGRCDAFTPIQYVMEIFLVVSL